jgi:prepilin-type processing-associated H-X9-DG protein
MSRDLSLGQKLVSAVVVGVIALMFIAMLFPAIRSGPANPANTCRNNLRNIAFAVMYYEDRHGNYPGFFEWDANAKGQVLWRPLVYNLLPYLEREDVFEAYNRDNHPQNNCRGVYLAILVCPADLQPTGTPTSYVFNGGRPDDQYLDNPANGVFVHSAKAGAKTWNYNNSKAFITEHDGTATTLVLSENLDAGSWTDWSEVRCGFLWDDYPKSVWPQVKINGDNMGDSPGQVANHVYFAKPTSNHPGCVNVAFADGHVRSLSEDIDYTVYAHLCTPWSAGARNANNKPIVNFPLNTQPLDEHDIR